jgi:mono/diheme cytochrome c family protein
MGGRRAALTDHAAFGDLLTDEQMNDVIAYMRV